MAFQLCQGGKDALTKLKSHEKRSGSGSGRGVGSKEHLGSSRSGAELGPGAAWEASGSGVDFGPGARCGSQQVRSQVESVTRPKSQLGPKSQATGQPKDRTPPRNSPD